jgi:Zn-dependent protease
MNLMDIIVVGVPGVLAITVHEVAHGWAANRLGDPTAARLGRLSLNPLRHIDPIGSVLLPVLLKLVGSPFLFGWAKPVPVNWENLRNPRRDMALVAAAGPASNLLMLCIWALLFAKVGTVPGLREMCWTGVLFNATIMALNLIPIPPLDGSRVLSAFLPPRLAVAYNRLEPFGLLIVIVLLATGMLGILLKPMLMVAGLVVKWLIG